MGTRETAAPFGGPRAPLAEPGGLLHASGIRLSARRMACRTTLVAVRRRHSVHQRQPGLVGMVDTVAARSGRPWRKRAARRARRGGVYADCRHSALETAVRPREVRL